MFPSIDPILESRRRSATQATMESPVHSEKRYSYPGVMPIRGGPPSSLPREISGRRRYASPQQQLPKTPRSESPSASEVLGAAFASEDQQSSIFPAAIYRDGSHSRSRSSQTSTRSSVSSASTSPSVTGRSSLDSARLSPPTSDGRERSYSPLAAGFARLNQKESNAGSSPGRDARGRPDGSKSSLELEARLFAGPA